MGCCQACLSVLSGSNSSASSSLSAIGQGNSVCSFDRRFTSKNLTVTDRRTVVEGNGGGGIALADTPIEQLRAYWEFKIVAFDRSAGAHFSVGVMRRANMKPPPNDSGLLSAQLGSDTRSKALRSTECEVQFALNDVIGVSLDMNYKIMKFYLNGIRMDFELKLGPRFSAPYPALYVSNGVRIEANFSGSMEDGKAWYAFPEELHDYSGIVAARSIL